MGNDRTEYLEIKKDLKSPSFRRKWKSYFFSEKKACSIHSRDLSSFREIAHLFLIGRAEAQRAGNLGDNAQILALCSKQVGLIRAHCFD